MHCVISQSAAVGEMETEGVFVTEMRLAARVKLAWPLLGQVGVIPEEGFKMGSNIPYE